MKNILRCPEPGKLNGLIELDILENPIADVLPNFKVKKRSSTPIKTLVKSRNSKFNDHYKSVPEIKFLEDYRDGKTRLYPDNLSFPSINPDAPPMKINELP
jgi:hypothetical protein